LAYLGNFGMRFTASIALAGTTLLFQVQDIGAMATATYGEEHGIQKKLFAFPWWIYTTEQMRQEATEQFHYRARCTIDFGYKPSLNEKIYLQSYCHSKDAFRYVPDSILARYVTMSNFVALGASPIGPLGYRHSWVPLNLKRTYCDHQLPVSPCIDKISAVRDLCIHLDISDPC
jgi:hypothetical protein